MSILRITFSIFCVFLLTLGAARAQDSRNLSEVLHLAYTQNPSLQAQRMRLKATEEQLAQAEANYRPVISSTLDITSARQDGSNFSGSSEDGSTSKNIALQAVQPLYRGGRTKAAMDAAHYTIKAARAELDAVEQDFLLQVITAYTHVLRDQHVLALRLQDLRDIEVELEASELRFEVGDITKTDVALAQARLARIGADVTAARGQLKRSSAIYEEYVGEAPTYLNAPILGGYEISGTLEALKKEVAQTHPDILNAQYSYDAQGMAVDEIRGELLPEIDLTGLWNRTYDPQPGIIDEQTNRSVGIQANIPLYLGGGVKSRIRAAKYTAEEFKLNIDTIRRDVIRTLVSSWADWQAAKDEITARLSQVAAEELAWEGMNLERELGTRSTLDVLTVNQNLTQARVNLVNAQSTEVIAKYTVLAAAGQLDHDVLTPHKRLKTIE